MNTTITVAGIFLGAMVASPAAILEQDTIPSEENIRAESSIALPLHPPNEVVRGDLIFSGGFVQMLAAEKPFELINPLAPVGAGQAENNTTYDLTTGKSEGLKLFAISF
jgi:hypothetical protein